MERTMSVEEKIKRAEEIYARRHEQDLRGTVYLNGKEKKDIKLFRKMILQIVVCLLIYLIVYTIQNNNYIFSEEFINKARELLTNDTNFNQMYENISKSIINVFSNENKEQVNSGEPKTIDNAEENENTSEKKEDIQVENKEENKEEKAEDPQVVLSEEEQKINEIKNTTTFIKPIQGTISSKYGLREPTTETVPKNHTGTDIAANLGTEILSSTDGEVVIASSEGDYGNHLKIQIGNVSIIYAHCNKLYVNQGDKVVQGQKIAEVGSTGNSTGPHLHFEIRLNEKTIDPEKILELQ